MAQSLRLNAYTKLILIALLFTVTVSSVSIQTASAYELLPSPVFTTATQMVHDVLQNKVFVIPTKLEQTTTEQSVEIENDLATKYTKHVVVTAYNSVPWQTDASPCISADGSNICQLKEKGEQSCAAALPFGTKVNIPGFGVCTVRDRLAPRFSNRIDLYFGGVEQIGAAKQWGKRHLEVAVLDTI